MSAARTGFEWVRQFGRTGRSGAVAGNAIIIAGGTMVAHVAALVAAPVLTRLYAPVEFARLELFVGAMSIGALIATLRFDLALVGARRRQAAYLVLISMVATLPVAVLTSLCVHLAGKRGWLGLHTLSLPVQLALIPGVCCMAWFTTLRYWFVRTEQFSAISKLIILQGLARVGAQILVGIVGPGLAGLVIGELVGRTSGVTTAARMAFREVTTLARLRIAPMFGVARRFRRFPLVMLPASLIDIIGLTATVPVLAQLYGAEAAGFFALVQRTLASPLGLIGGSVGDAFHSRLAQHARKDPDLCMPLFLRTGLLLGGAGIVLAVGLHFFAVPVFGLVFGRKWLVAGELAAAMGPAAGFLLLTTTLSRSVLVFHAQHLILLVAVLNLTAVVASLAIGAHLGWPLARAVHLLSIAQATVFAFYVVLQLAAVVIGVRQLKHRAKT